MRSPSIYSQDDPISAALKPSPTETEAERSARLVREVDAKRVSEQIDEDLRLERERLKKRKGDVKVCYEIPQHLVRIYLLLSTLRSCCYWVKQKAANRPFRNNSS
jgi:hypothetical protein